jgi:hypothetical protein
MPKPAPSALFPTISHSKKRALLLAYAETGRLREACRAATMDHKLHYYWKRTDPDYAAAYEEAQQIAGELLEEEAIRRAQGWEETHYTLAGTPYPVTKHSDTLLIFLLKGTMPHKYGERVAHTGARDGPVEFVLKVIYANERPGLASGGSPDSPQIPASPATPFRIQPGEA